MARSSIFRLFLALILLFEFGAMNQSVLALGSEIAANYFVAGDNQGTSWNVEQSIPDSYTFVAENDLFQLYVNKTALSFKVVDKRSGYIWSSNLDEKIAGDRLNKTWTAFAQSGVSIDYIDSKMSNGRVSITNGKVSIDTALIDKGIKATVHFLDPAISMDIVYRLEDAGVSVEIPFNSVTQENPDFTLGILYAFPFFGATRGDSVPGYMFIPDGSGSLIQFGNTTKASTMYYGKYYGDDRGMITYPPYDPALYFPLNISIPVIGMVHGEKQNAYICIVEKGAPYGEIQAHPSGIITNFNFIYNTFTYNQTYFQATNRAGDGVTIVQPETNAFDIKLQYRFLTSTDSDYVGMAKSYQRFLVEKGVLKKVVNGAGDIGIRLEFLGGEKKKVLLWDSLIPMTTIAQMDTILNDLGIINTEVVYYGWQPHGASTMPPATLKVESQLGRLDQLRALAHKINAGGGHFYLYLNPQAAFEGEKGYSLRKDLAISITDDELIGRDRGRWGYYLNFPALSRRYLSLSKTTYTELGSGLALDGIGSLLYSDYKKNNNLSREEAIVKYQELLSENQGITALYLPNDYMFSYMNAYYDIPLDDNGYIFTTQSIPFLQIVLAGYVPFYGPAMNFSANTEEDLLKQIDYDVYPSYFLTNEVTARILDTRSDWIYTSSYAQWGQNIRQSYQWLNSLLGPVKGQEVVARQMLADGVSATTYANGKQIIVNYNDAPFTYHGVTIEGKNAGILEVTP